MLDTVVSSNENRRFAFAKGSPRLYRRGRMSLLGMQLGSELQLDTEEKREDVLMQLVAMQRLVEKAEYSPDLAFEYFGYSEQKRQLYKKVVDYMIDVSK